MLIGFLIDIPLYLVMPLVGILCCVIAVVYKDHRNSIKKYQEVVDALNAKMIAAVDKLNKTYKILGDEYRAELREILDEAHSNEVKIVEVLNQMNNVNENIVKEVNELSQSVKNISIELKKTKSRKS